MLRPAAIVALAAACRDISALAPGDLAAHETSLLRRLREGLAAIRGVRLLSLWSDDPASERIGVVSFTVEDYAAELVVQYLLRISDEDRGGCARG